MDFDLSADQRALGDAARALLAEAASSVRVRATVEARSGFDPSLWDALTAQGWLSVLVPDDAGGLGMGAVELAVLAEAVGERAAPVPFIETSLALAVLVDAEPREGPVGVWIERLAAGTAKGCVAGLDPVGGRAVVHGRELHGRLGPVVGAPLADVAVVVAGAGEAASVHLLELDDDHRPPAEPAMDLTRSLGWLDLEGATAMPLGGSDAVDRLLDLAAATYAAELLGTAQSAMEMAVDHAKEREQFGRPIGSFQAVKHRCADMLVDVEGMRSAAYWAAWCVSVDDAERSIAASTAKVWCSDAGLRVAQSAMQVLGGIGFTWEHDLHLLLKRAHLSSMQAGGASVHRDRLASMLRARLVAGQPVV